MHIAREKKERKTEKQTGAKSLKPWGRCLPRVLGSFKEEQGGKCGWSTVSEGMEKKRSKTEVRLGFSSVQWLICVRLFVTPWTAACQASLSITNSLNLLKLMSILPSPPASNLSQHQGLFQWVSPSHQVAKVLEFQLQHQSFQWIFRTDFL